MMRILLPAIATSLIVFAQLAKAPRTRKDNVVETLHGVKITDPYRWLEDQHSPETRRWIDEQNAYSRPFLDAVPSRGAISKRLTDLMRIDAMWAPQVENGRYFFGRRRADQQQFVLYVRKGLKGSDEMLVDPQPMSPDRTTSAGIMDVSRDGSLMAYSIRRGGEDEITVKLLNVDTRKELPDTLPRARYFSVSIKPDNSGLFYAKHTDAGTRIYYHRIGAPVASDRKIFGDAYGPEIGISSDVSEDGRYLVLHVMYGSSADKTEIWVQDLARGGPVAPVVKDIAARFFGNPGADRLFVHTNWKAPNGRVLAIDLRNPALEKWRTIVPEAKDAIDSVSLAGGRICVSYLHDAVSRVTIFEPDGRRVREIDAPALGTVTSLSGHWGTSEAFYAFTSFHIPTTVYRYDVATGSQDVWFREPAPVKSEDFELKQVWYASKDETKIPMFVLHRKGLKLDGTAPALLTGYGGFTVSLTPGFDAAAVLWAERGGVFAQPNLRGGGEFGEAWHKAGMLGHKQNVFDDFVGAAEWLIASRYTTPAKLGIEGGSNGGLLVGAALTQRPELFGAVVCAYPLLDMLRYQKFLLAKWWVPEYGSADDPAQFKWLYAYSPYHHVKPGVKYPAVLFITGDSDTRVAPLHARKMAALLQGSTGSNRPVLLLYDTKSGHSGGRPLSKEIEIRTDELSFLWSQLGAR